mgnify:CR=1 FL=1
MSYENLLDAFEVQQFIQRTAALLNAEKLSEWLEQFHSDGLYEITAYSTELGKELAWWKQELPLLQKTISEVPRHVRDPAKRLHVLGPPLVSVTGDAARGQTAFSVFRTLPTGETSLFVVGRYLDGSGAAGASASIGCNWRHASSMHLRICRCRWRSQEVAHNANAPDGRLAMSRSVGQTASSYVTNAQVSSRSEA